MKLKHSALTLGCIAALGMAGTAHAIEVVGDLLEVYGNFYPQHQVTTFGDSVATGTRASQMTRAQSAVAPTTTFAAAAPTRILDTTVNSYLGFRGKKTFGDVTVGYDYQSLLTRTFDGVLPIFYDRRDSFVYVEHPLVGNFTAGQLDTIYKEFGDRVRMLGVSSSNFVSTSGVLSGVGWRSIARDTATTSVAGTTSFNTRIGDQLRWISPKWRGVEVGVSLPTNTEKSLNADKDLTAMGIRWSDDTYYVALAQEVHKDYRGFSGTGAVETAATILNRNPRSRDVANRLSFGYKADKLRIGADVANLQYTEDAVSVGKFTNYSTTTWQVSGEYKLNPQVAVSANYAVGYEGTCSILGGGVCSTAGQGGTLLSLGARYDFNKYVGVFALYALNSANDSATYASGAIGAKVTNAAVGVQVKF